MLIFWVILLVLLVIIEALTAQLVSIWFVFGALGGLIANIAGAPVWLQLVIFGLISIISLIATRPLVKKITVNKKTPTNADRFIGARAVVTEDIDNTFGKGEVNVHGSIWSARSLTGEVINKGAVVIINEIEGVKLLVSKID